MHQTLPDGWERRLQDYYVNRVGLVVTYDSEVFNEQYAPIWEVPVVFSNEDPFLRFAWHDVKPETIQRLPPGI